MTLVEEIINDLSYIITEVLKKYDFYRISEQEDNSLNLLFSDRNGKFQFRIKIEIFYEQTKK